MAENFTSRNSCHAKEYQEFLPKKSAEILTGITLPLDEKKSTKVQGKGNEWYLFQIPHFPFLREIHHALPEQE